MKFLIPVFFLLIGSKGLAVEKATFAGGCFWCIEEAFTSLEGVESATSGYTGGETENPTYEEVTSGKTGHVEAVQVVYDEALTSYSELLEIFWHQVDPTDAGGQFADRGSQYKTAIFYHSETQKQQAEESKAALEKSGRYPGPIVTPILPATTFYPAEEYHQDYAEKNPIHYKRYKEGSGRAAYIRENRLEELTPLQRRVTQEEGTEPAFDNLYWDHKDEGIYVDIVSGEPLFASVHKYDSGTGWPSFWRPLEPDNIVTKEDNTLFMSRTEVRSKQADSHLGHGFPDGPEPTGQRFCINSAALRFVPVEEMEEQGYEDYLHFFE